MTKPATRVSNADGETSGPLLGLYRPQSGLPSVDTTPVSLDFIEEVALATWAIVGEGER